MHRHRPVRVGFPHGHMMFAVTAASIPTETHHRRRRGRSNRTSVNTHEGLSLRFETKSTQRIFPPEPTRTRAHQRRESPLARRRSHRSRDLAPHALPSPRRRATRTSAHDCG